MCILMESCNSHFFLSLYIFSLFSDSTHFRHKNVMSNNTTQPPRRRRERPRGSTNRNRNGQSTEGLIDAFHAEFVEGTVLDGGVSRSETEISATHGGSARTTTRAGQATRATRSRVTRATTSESTHATETTTASTRSTRNAENNDLQRIEEERVDVAGLAQESDLNEEYVPVDLQDVMMVGEIGETEEGIENREGRVNAGEVTYEVEINKMRRRCISDSSRTTYTNANIAFINYFARLEFNDEYTGIRPLRATWLAQLSQFLLADDKNRKKWIKQKLEARDLDLSDPPIDFETLQPGNLYEVHLFYIFDTVTNLSLFYYCQVTSFFI